MKKSQYIFNLLGFACIISFIFFLVFGARDWSMTLILVILTGLMSAPFFMVTAWKIGDKKWRLASLITLLVFVGYLFAFYFFDVLQSFRLDSGVPIGYYIAQILLLFPFVLFGLSITKESDKKLCWMTRIGLVASFLIYSYFWFIIWHPF